jgi:hypothetical protein
MIRNYVSALLLTTILMWGTQARAENQCSVYGINSHLPTQSDLEMIKAAGIDWVRFDFNWFQLEPSNNSFQWQVTDPIVNKAHELGLNMFATLSYTPQWASANPNCTPNHPGADGCNTQPFSSVAEWQDFVTKVVSRYKGKIKHWGMWNEPNLDHFYSGTEDQYVYDILIPGAQAAKAADPGAVICGPELAGVRGSDDWNGDEGTCLFGECIFNGWEVSLANVLDKAGDHIDVITHHFYKDDAHQLAAQILEGQFEIIIQVSHSLKEIIEGHGQGQEVWLAEWGWHTKAYGGYNGGGDYTEQEQATFSAQFFELREQIAAGTYPESSNDPWPQLTKLFLYDWHDGVEPIENKLWAFGIVDVDGNPKPAYNALKDYFLANPPNCGAVNPGAKPPVMSGMPDVLLIQGKANPHAVDLAQFTEDEDTPDGQLIFSVQGADPAEVGASIKDGHFLSVIPQGNWQGQGTVQVQASDGNATDTASVSVEVVPAQKPAAYTALEKHDIVIDGSLLEFGDSKEVVLSPPDHWAGLQGDMPSVLDIQARFRVAWEPGALYVAVEVTDDVHSNEYEPDMSWMGDSVQIAVDGANDKNGPGYDGNDWEVGAALLQEVPSAGCWHKPDGFTTCPVQVSGKRVGNMTRYEIKIPGDFSGQVGLSVLVNDNDGAGRDGWLEWTPGVGFAKDPSFYGNVFLQEEGAPPVDTGTPSDIGPTAPDVVTGKDNITNDNGHVSVPDVGSCDNPQPWVPDSFGDSGTIGPAGDNGSSSPYPIDGWEEGDEVSTGSGCSSSSAGPFGLLLLMALVCCLAVLRVLTKGTSHPVLFCR